jgi:hypothetical protein
MDANFGIRVVGGTQIDDGVALGAHSEYLREHIWINSKEFIHSHLEIKWERN